MDDVERLTMRVEAIQEDFRALEGAVDFYAALDAYTAKLTTDLRGFSAGEGLELWVPTEGDDVASLRDMIDALRLSGREVCIKLDLERALAGITAAGIGEACRQARAHGHHVYPLAFLVTERPAVLRSEGADADRLAGG